MKRAVVLFTRDLRVHDHAALSAAVESASEIVPLFVLDDALRYEQSSPVRRAFLLDSLGDVRQALRERDGDLAIRRGDTVEETLRVAHRAAASVVFVGADASTFAQRRQERLARACRRERIELLVENTIGAVPVGELVPAGRDHYRIFTPYWRRWCQQPLPALLDPPRRVSLPSGIEPGDLPSAPPGQRGGEHAARRRLDGWLRGGLHQYETARNELASEGTSRLSSYLHFGCISPTEVVTRARAKGAIAEAFVRQLCWRDFFLQLLNANPHTASHDLRNRDRAWIEDEDALAAWAEGRTGYPIVDAAMRQLRAEGWVHNRGRLLVASFLTKTLGIDWRQGARVFLELLVDGDVANNAGNWQWVAGTGVDSRPNRVFNPIAQAKRLDPQGKYVRACARARRAERLSHPRALARAARSAGTRVPRANRRPGAPCSASLTGGGPPTSVATAWSIRTSACTRNTGSSLSRQRARSTSAIATGPKSAAQVAGRCDGATPGAGLLARRPGGAITLSQSGSEEPELRATVTAFVPRLAPPFLYDRFQHRLHVRISRRYFRRLITEAAG